MLKVIRVDSIEEKKKIFSQFDPETSTWIVSDLRSKIELQKLLLQRGMGTIQEDSILRVSEFWKKLLLRSHPELSFVSPSLIKALAFQFLSKESTSSETEKNWNHSFRAAEALYNYTELFLPILGDVGGHERLGEWFHQNPESFVRWGQWYLWANGFWQELLTMGIIPISWCKGVLQHDRGFESNWTRSLILDLGFEMTTQESSLFDSIALHIPVEALVPCDEALPLESRRAYQSWLPLKKSTTGPSRELIKCEFRKFAAQVAEAKDAVAQVRLWLGQNVQPKQIAVVAPDIEQYWPVLAAYFAEEGIPVQKSVVRSLQSFADIQVFLGKLRLRVGRTNTEDLELSLYSTGVDPLLPYAQFKQTYENIYQSRDIGRIEQIGKLIRQPKSETAVLGRDEFLKWAALSLESGSQNQLLLIQKLLSEAPGHLQFELEKWLAYLEHLAGKIEVEMVPECSGGVHGLNISAAEWIGAKYVYVLGLEESQMRSAASPNLIHQDLQRLASDLGYVLKDPEFNLIEQNLEWILQQQMNSVVLSSYETDFLGRATAPAMYWLKKAMKSGVDLNHVSIPQPTRWDEIQRLEPGQLKSHRGHIAALESLFSQQLRVDLGLEKESSLLSDARLSLSASSIEKYIKCPFQYAAEKIWQLKDEPSLDLELDAMSRGRLRHALLEEFVREPFSAQISDTEIVEKIEKMRESGQLRIIDEDLWALMRGPLVTFVRNFLVAEGEWRKQFSATQTIGREVKILGYWNLDEGRLSTEPGKLGIVFRGSIDRVDSDGAGESVILDYKSSVANLNQPSAWIEKVQFQLPLYVESVQRGLTPLPQVNIVGAFYLNLRDFTRGPGFRLTSGGGNLFSLDDRKKDKLSEEELVQLMSQMNATIQEAALKMTRGEFAPAPRELSECDTCSWRDLCRASHLN